MNLTLSQDLGFDDTLLNNLKKYILVTQYFDMAKVFLCYQQSTAMAV